MLITFEGIEGCGKSTQARLFYERLIQEGYPALLTREPGDTPLGKKLRSLLLHETMDPLTEVLLFLADRREHITSLIRPSLQSGSIVVCDRYYHSTLAYQVYGRGINREWIDSLHRVILENTLPSRVYLLDIDIELAFYRKKHHTLDRIENETKNFHQRVREGFLKLAQEDPTIVVLDGSLSPQVLHETIWKNWNENRKKEG